MAPHSILQVSVSVARYQRQLDSYSGCKEILKGIGGVGTVRVQPVGCVTQLRQVRYFAESGPYGLTGSYQRSIPMLRSCLPLPWGFRCFKKGKVSERRPPGSGMAWLHWRPQGRFPPEKPALEPGSSQVIIPFAPGTSSAICQTRTSPVAQRNTGLSFVV